MQENGSIFFDSCVYNVAWISEHIHALNIWILFWFLCLQCSLDFWTHALKICLKLRKIDFGWQYPFFAWTGTLIPQSRRTSLYLSIAKYSLQPNERSNMQKIHKHERLDHKHVYTIEHFSSLSTITLLSSKVC